MTTTSRQLCGLELVAMPPAQATMTRYGIGLPPSAVADADLRAMIYAVSSALEFSSFCLFDHPDRKIVSRALVIGARPNGETWLAPLNDAADPARASDAILTDGVRGYAIAVEAWMTPLSLDYMAPGPRVEVVMIYGCAANGETLNTVFEIERGPDGKPRDLAFMPRLSLRGHLTREDAPLAVHGALADLFMLRAAREATARHGVN